MRLSNNFFYTIREDQKDEETLSGNLMVRSGMVKKVSNGIYMYMPLGLKLFKNIENIIRKHIDEAGANELLMPNLIPSEVYEKSNRKELFGNDMFNLQDRNQKQLVLGPTHEELFVEAAKMKIKSYKDMPFNIYQIGNKYRDEPRPRYGLIRVREFFMKDAYSFDINQENCLISYKKMKQAYINIFKEIGIDYRIVTADTGVMGGLLSEEFQAITNIGEDTLVLCDCGYSSNLEVSSCKIKESKLERIKELEEIYTPECKTIEEVANYLNEKPEKFVKTLIYKIDNKFYAVLVSGEYEVNEIKLRKLLKATDIQLATEQEVLQITNCEIGYIGPINIKAKIIIDQDLQYKYNYITGANIKNYHFKNVNTANIKYDIIADIKTIKETDSCPNCNKTVYFKKGVEIGNIFNLGNKYSKALDLKYLDNDNQLIPVEMGCYGIGLGRILAAYIEQNHDESGIVFNKKIAPYKVAIVIIDINNEKQTSVANALYRELKKITDVIIDDRDERPGVKFKDTDLIGVPYRITIGKKINDELVELKARKRTESVDIHVNDIIKKIKDFL